MALPSASPLRPDAPPRPAHAASGGVVLRVVSSAALIGAITLVGYRFFRLNATSAGFAYLVAILAVATRWGLVEAVAASVVAVFCLNFFFLPPVLTLTIADPQNWLGLLAFLATSLIASQLSARAKQRTGEALDRQREMERLYALSRSILLTNPDQPLARQIVLHIAQIFDFSAAALFDRAGGAFHHSGPDEFPPDIDDRLREAALKGTLFRDEASGTVVTAVRLGGEPIGALALRGAPPSDTVLQALANLAAIGLERARSQDAATRAEAARASQELKSTLLDAMAHEFKTPLTSMKAASSAFLSDTVVEPEGRRELVSVIDEEIDHLNRLVTEAIQVARIEAGDVQLNCGRYSPSAMLEGLRRESAAASEGRAVSVEVEPDLPALNVDAELIKLALRQLMDNALRYSPAGSPVALRAGRDGNRVVMSVRDRGPGIPPGDRARIFEKFYRGSRAGQTRGTGMGLSIAREIARAHQGDLWLASSSPEGSEFCLSIPVMPDKVAK